MQTLDFSISGQTLFIAVSAILLSLIALVMGMKYFLSRRDISKDGNSTLFKQNKYSEVDVLRWTGTIWKLGLVVALAMVSMAFAYTNYSVDKGLVVFAEDLDDIIEMDIPITDHFTPPPPPPPMPKVEVVPDETVIDEPQILPSIDLEPESEVYAEPFVEKVIPAKPPVLLPEKEEGVDEIIDVVEEMPRFPGCEGEGLSKKDRKICSDRKLLTFLAEHIKYPPLARENNIEGMVVVQFVVERDGSISNVKVVRDIGAGCGKEALRVVNLMNAKKLLWTPGKQMGRKVRVQFNLPVRFELER